MVLTKKKNMSRKQNLKSRKQISKSRKNGLKSKKNMRGSGKFGNKFKVFNVVKSKFSGAFSPKSPLTRQPAMKIKKAEPAVKVESPNQNIKQEEQQKVEVEVEPQKPKQPNILHRIAQSVGSTTKGMKEYHKNLQNYQLKKNKFDIAETYKQRVAANEASQRQIYTNLEKEPMNLLKSSNVSSNFQIKKIEEQIKRLQTISPNLSKEEIQNKILPFVPNRKTEENIAKNTAIRIKHQQIISNNESKQKLSEEANKYALEKLEKQNIKDLDISKENLTQKLSEAETESKNKGVQFNKHNATQKIIANHYKAFNTHRNSYLQKKLEESKKLNVSASVKVDLTKSFTEVEKKNMLNNLKTELTNKNTNISGYLDDIILLKQKYDNTTNKNSKNPENFSKEISRLLIDTNFTDDLKNKMIETFYHLDTKQIEEIITPNPTITTPNSNITKPNPIITTPNPTITTPNPIIITPKPNITNNLEEQKKLYHKNKLGIERTNEFKNLVKTGVITETFGLSEKLKTSDLSRDMLTTLISTTKNQNQKQLLQNLFNRTNPDTVPMETYRTVNSREFVTLEPLLSTN